MNKFIKFSLAGTVNTLVDWSVYFLMNHVVLDNNNDSVSKITGIVFGIISAFLLNILWVFRNEFQYLIISSANKLYLIWALFFQFVLTYSFGMLINYFTFMGLRLINMPELYALLISTVGSFSFNYLFVKNFILTVKR